MSKPRHPHHPWVQLLAPLTLKTARPTYVEGYDTESAERLDSIVEGHVRVLTMCPGRTIACYVIFRGRRSLVVAPIWSALARADLRLSHAGRTDEPKLPSGRVAVHGFTTKAGVDAYLDPQWFRVRRDVILCEASCTADEALAYNAGLPHPNPRALP